MKASWPWKKPCAEVITLTLSIDDGHLLDWVAIMARAKLKADQ